MTDDVRTTRLLFATWWDSIHARRRIQLCVDDPRFEVVPVCPHNCAFECARDCVLAEENWTIGRSARGYYGELRDRSKQHPAVAPMREVAVAARHLEILKRAVAEFRPGAVFSQTLLYCCCLANALYTSLLLPITFWISDVRWRAKTSGIERQLKKRIVTHRVRRAVANTVKPQVAFEARVGNGREPEESHLVRQPGVDLQRFSCQYLLDERAP